MANRLEYESKEEFKIISPRLMCPNCGAGSFGVWSRVPLIWAGATCGACGTRVKAPWFSLYPVPISNLLAAAVSLYAGSENLGPAIGLSVLAMIVFVFQLISVPLKRSRTPA